MGKYIIEIEDDSFIRYECFPGEEKLYIAKGFKSLVFDQNGLDKLTPYDESAAELRGAEKAWKMAQRIAQLPMWGGMSGAELLECFGRESSAYIIDMPYAEVAKKYELWQKKKTVDDEIKVGDEVRIKTDPSKICIVTNVTKVDDRIHFSCMEPDGLVDWFSSATYFEKTGRHFPEVAKLLKKIGGDNDCTEM